MKNVYDKIGFMWNLTVIVAVLVIPMFLANYAQAAPDVRPFAGYYQVTSSFWSARNGGQSYHLATDYATPLGTTINATDSGTVTKVFDNGPAGLTVFVDHGVQEYKGKKGRVQTRYIHLYKALVQEGQTVSKGDRIAISGASGYQQLGEFCIPVPPHLHYAIYFDGLPVNAADFIFGRYK